MANPQPQSPPPQPIYPRDLNYALDRIHNRFVEYADAKDGALAAQMRVGFAEAYNRDMEAFQRDDALLRRIENVESGITALANTVLSIVERISSIEATQRSMEAMQQTMLQLIKDLHAEAMEAINDLRPKNIE